VRKQPPSETEISCLLATMTLSCTLSSTRDTSCGFFRGPRDWLGRPRFDGHLDSKDGTTESRCER
jgi:hypothetical protein